jgi:hypothetical protein
MVGGGLAVAVDEGHVAEGQARSIAESAHHALKPFGVEGVVGVEDGQEVAPGQAQALVEGGVGALVVVMAQGAQARIADRLDGIPGAVPGGVVDDDQLQVAEGLGQDAVQGIDDVGLVVEGRNDHADLGGGHGAWSWW